jgi:3-hydroxyethyl bacteriochlorophyllide a dehydrogenase
MPDFPGMGYPLVPGYESVGRVREAGARSGKRAGEWVFVPGARCFGAVRGLFGGAAMKLVVPGARTAAIEEKLQERGVLLALAATAFHAMAPQSALPDLIIGHGVLGRLLARLARLRGGSPVVWERNPGRMDHAADDYRVLRPEDDPRRDYRAIYDVSGDAGILDTLVRHLAPQGEIVLAGFYHERIAFDFAPAFMKEARIRVSAEWRPADLAAVNALAASGELSLEGLITHRQHASAAPSAYRTAFDDPACLKMVLDWRAAA